MRFINMYCTCIDILFKNSDDVCLNSVQVHQVAYIIIKAAISSRPGNTNIQSRVLNITFKLSTCNYNSRHLYCVGNWILERSLDGIVYMPWYVLHTWRVVFMQNYCYMLSKISGSIMQSVMKNVGHDIKFVPNQESHNMTMTKK